MATDSFALQAGVKSNRSILNLLENLLGMKGVVLDRMSGLAEVGWGPPAHHGHQKPLGSESGVLTVNCVIFAELCG